METIRTFIALELPEGLKAALSQIQRKFMQRSPCVRWVQPAHMHLTLKFLGATRIDTVPEVSRVLEQTTKGAAPFVYTVSGLGAFPNARNPKVIWAGMQIDDRLVSFQEKLENGLAALGFPKEKRPFAPHLTLGRVKEGKERKELSALLETFGGEDMGRVECSRVIFFRSDLKPSGPVYSILKDIELSASS